MVVIRDIQRVRNDPRAAVIEKMWTVVLGRSGRMSSSVPVRVYRSDVERLRELGRLFPRAVVICVQLRDGGVRKLFAVRERRGSAEHVYLLP
jgi:hypothetical protein